MKLKKTIAVLGVILTGAISTASMAAGVESVSVGGISVSASALIIVPIVAMFGLQTFWLSHVATKISGAVRELRIEMSELNKGLHAHELACKDRDAQIDKRLEQTDRRLGQIDQRLEQNDRRLERLEKLDAERLAAG